MPEFEYRAKDGPERIIEGVLEAPSESAAVERINQLGYVPVTVRPRRTVTSVSVMPVSTLSPRGVFRRNNSRRVIFISRQLATLIKAGVPILRALQTLSRQSKDMRLRGVLESLVTQISQGDTLSQSMARQEEFFSPMFVAIVKAGESSGDLEAALLRIAEHLRKQEELRSKVGKALAYPLILAVTGFATVFFILTFVIPKLTKLFLGLGQELPLPTRIVMAASSFLSDYWIGVLVAVASLVFGAPYLIRRSVGEGHFALMKLRLPFWGNLIFKSEFGRFSRTLEMSLSHGIPFLEAVHVASLTFNNLLLAAAIEECRKKVQKGETFGGSLRQYSYFPPFVTDLVAIGEESGRLDQVLREIATAYEQEVEETMTFFTTLLEPAMILIVGAFVGFIVMAMLLPIFEMNTII